jgi:hypothetical protein
MGNDLRAGDGGKTDVSFVVIDLELFQQDGFAQELLINGDLMVPDDHLTD